MASEESDKQLMAKQAFNTSLLSKVFSRLRESSCKLKAPSEDSSDEIAFLRELGSHPLDLLLISIDA